METKVKLVSCLEKVFMDEEPKGSDEILQGFQNERLSFQIAYNMPNDRVMVKVKIVSPIAEHVRVREVRNVPVGFTTHPDADDNYLRKAPGMFPDLLTEQRPLGLSSLNGRWDAFWIDINPTEEMSGFYPVTVCLVDQNDQLIAAKTQNVIILKGLLPKQTLIHTKWFYCDCIAQAYNVEVWSEEHWRIVENFIRAAVDGGINMILMPVHTPPLDTRIGTERPTTQLVDVFVENGEYRFGMEKVRRWINMCKKCGVEYYEIAHLYTQWGAAHAPKIIATVDGVEKRIFGWETEAVSDEYEKFLNAYIPALIKVFKEEGIDQFTRWHISDEPTPNILENYMKAKNQVKPLLEGYRIMDALSNFEFYACGAVENPVPGNNHIEPFLEAKVPDLWTYYCVGQYKDVSNMFIAMPSARNRILGVQLFKFNIVGFLQWGFNFYNTALSDYPIDPYANTDADGTLPAGDPFQVYPGKNGVPEESIRMAVTRQAMQDLRAFNRLAELTSREHVIELIDAGLEKPVTFSEYPHDAEYIINLRRRVDAEIVRNS